MKLPVISIFLILLFILILGPPGIMGEANSHVLSPHLRDKIKSSSEHEILYLIVQFEDEVNENDLKVLDILGFEIIQTFHVIPAVHVFGTRNSIIELSNYERTNWIETNDKIKYNLDVSTAAVNATNTWNRLITDLGGDYDYIDGTDVTVVVADTGIDATHPDLDYREKTILNLKKDLDHPGSWKEMENTDTFFGHGTHCAGIIGGTGEASAGARRGVAPGVSLIGLSIGDPWETNEVGGLEWVYDNSKPNANPYNIKVVSNSWGYEEQIDASFKDAVIQVIIKLSYENNVVVVFAASNDGEEDHDGHVSTTNIYGNVPAAISVAASQRDGVGLADFSSRGHRDQNDTWPDIAAPGVSIMSAKDSMGKMGKTNTENPYYIPASGTSMATPHIAGIVSLLFQAAPSLKISELHDDSSTTDLNYWSDPLTTIHEAEYILKVTADFMTEGDGLADNFSYDLEGKPHDYAQGYGLVNVERAVALALTLEKLRDEDEEVTVCDAFKVYNNIINDTSKVEDTDVLVASWNGEYSLHNDQNAKPEFVTSQVHYVHIANESLKLILDLSFPPINLDDNTIGSITITVDYDDDGNDDWSASLFDESALNGQRHDEIDISSGEYASQKGKLWAFSIYGYAVKKPLQIGQRPSPGGFIAPTIEYVTTVQQVLDVAEDEVIFVDYKDFRPSVEPLEFGEPTMEYNEGQIMLNTYEYNLSRAYFVVDIPPVDIQQDSTLIAIIMNIVMAILVAAALVRRYIKEHTIDSKIAFK
jgi:serine protease AprX